MDVGATTDSFLSFVSGGREQVEVYYIAKNNTNNAVLGSRFHRFIRLRKKLIPLPRSAPNRHVYEQFMHALRAGNSPGCSSKLKNLVQQQCTRETPSAALDDLLVQIQLSSGLTNGLFFRLRRQNAGAAGHRDITPRDISLLPSFTAVPGMVLGTKYPTPR